LKDEGHLVGSAKSGPMSWFLVYVWPAVALGQDHKLLKGFLAGLEAIDSLSAPAAAGLVPKLGKTPQTNDGLPLPHRSVGPHTSSAIPFASAVATPLRILLYVVMAAMLALLAFTVWTGFSSTTQLSRHRW
jgi:hypothetical protein